MLLIHAIDAVSITALAAPSRSNEMRTIHLRPCLGSLSRAVLSADVYIEGADKAYKPIIADHYYNKFGGDMVRL
jgi:hypothetical protein